MTIKGETPLFRDGIHERIANAATETSEDTEAIRSHGCIHASAEYMSTYNLFKDAPLFGRDVQTKALQDAFFRECDVELSKRRLTENRVKELTLVSGIPGTGKTELVLRTLKPLVEKAGGFFVAGKFDLQQRSEPFGPVADAIHQLVEKIHGLGDESVVDEATKIVRQLGDKILIDRVPALNSFVKPLNTTKEKHLATEEQQLTYEAIPTGFHAEIRLVYSSVRLLKEFSKFVGPIVVLLDDIQWADRPTLSFLETAVHDLAYDNIMIVVTCRGNEVSIEHHLAVVLRELEADGIFINNIVVENLNKDAVSEMTGSIFPMENETLIALINFVMTKTAGNAFFVVQYLQELVAEGTIKQVAERQWLFLQPELERNPEIMFTGTESDAVSFLVNCIRKLPLDLQKVLMYASCFGSVFQSILVETASGVDDLTNVLPSLQSLGYIQQVDAGKWRFAHDQTQKASKALISPQDMETFHLVVGRKLWNNLPKPVLDDYIYEVVEQLRLGARMIRDEKERTRLALFLLESGRMAAKASSFVQASIHLNLAIELLPPFHWRDHYSLCIDLYSSAAEVEYCNSNFARMNELIDKVSKQRLQKEDEMRAVMTKILAQSSRNQLVEATNLGRETLRDLSVYLPPQVGFPRILFHAWKTKRMLQRLSDDDILSLPFMNNYNKLMAVHVMNHVLSAAIFSSPTLALEMSMLLVRMTLQDGISGASCVGFTYSSWIFVFLFKDDKLGLRLARLSLRILEKFDATEWLSRISSLLYGMTFSLVEPLRNQLKPLRVAHRVGLSTGDIEHSLLAAGLCASVGIMACIPLGELITDAEQLLKMAKMHEHTKTVHLTTPAIQLAKNLSRVSDDSQLSTEEIMEEEAMLQECIAAKNVQGIATHFLCKLILHCIFSRYEEAEKAFQSLRKYAPKIGGGFAVASEVLYAGVASLALYRVELKHKRTRLATGTRCLRRLQEFSKLSSKNYHSKVCILEGELAYTKKDVSKALVKFEEAIAYGKESQLYSDVGLAAECAARALKNSRQSRDAPKYLGISLQAYNDWGASAKVAQMRKDWDFHDDIVEL